MKEAFPEYFAGFDLVGQEDKGTPLLGFIPQLLNAAEKGIKFFFHSGETGMYCAVCSCIKNYFDEKLLLLLI